MTGPTSRPGGTVVVALLAPVHWAPPGTGPQRWRAALAEDVVDLIAGLDATAAAIAAIPADRALAEAVRWPTTPVLEVPAATAAEALAAVATAGYDRAAVVCADAPDLPGLLVGKLLRPLSSRPVALAPAVGGGLLGLAARLPAPGWLPAVADLDDADAAQRVRAAAPRPAEVGTAPAWHRLRGPDDLRRLDPGLEGWEATRALLDGTGARG